MKNQSMNTSKGAKSKRRNIKRKTNIIKMETGVEAEVRTEIKLRKGESTKMTMKHLKFTENRLI